MEYGLAHRRTPADQRREVSSVRLYQSTRVLSMLDGVDPGATMQWPTELDCEGTLLDQVTRSNDALDAKLAADGATHAVQAIDVGTIERLDRVLREAVTPSSKRAPKDVEIPRMDKAHVAMKEAFDVLPLEEINAALLKGGISPDLQLTKLHTTVRETQEWVSKTNLLVHAVRAGMSRLGQLGAFVLKSIASILVLILAMLKLILLDVPRGFLRWLCCPSLQYSTLVEDVKLEMDYIWGTDGKAAAAAAAALALPLKVVLPAGGQLELIKRESLKFDPTFVPIKSGFATVHRATTDTNKMVAVKILHDVVDTPEQLQAFLVEAEFMASLSGWHVLQIRGMCLGNGQAPWLITDWMEGGSLFSYLKEHPTIDGFIGVAGRVQLLLRLRMALECAQAVLFLHNRKVVHADLKSPNYLLTDNEDPHVQVGQSRCMHRQPVDAHVAESLCSVTSLTSFVSFAFLLSACCQVTLDWLV
jgi:hypothetical protein